MNTIELIIETNDLPIREQIIAELSETGFNAFEERDTELVAFINEESYDFNLVEKILVKYKVLFKQTIIEDQNWNALWESNFDPVIVDDFCAVRADFHSPVDDVRFDIIITPKMSFGTGHHATTYLMISEMSKIEFKYKRVADFGTGTGVLAILAEKLGGKSIVAIDYDEWSINNSKENIEKNNCCKINIEHADTFPETERFDIILANINRNVILDNLSKFKNALSLNGKLLLSGLLFQDDDILLTNCRTLGLKHLSTVERNKWICVLMCLE